MKITMQGKEPSRSPLWRPQNRSLFHRLCKQSWRWGVAFCWRPLPSPRARREYLDRGVVALPSGSGIYIGWRMLGDDPANIGFHVYRNGTRITSSPITNSTNYFDASGSSSAAYTVRPVVNGVEQAANPAKATWSNPYWLVNLNRPAGGTTPSGEAYSYSPNDLSVGDLDGDGQYDIIVKWEPSNAKDNSQSGYTGNVYVDAYRLNGSQLWRIDLGRNIRAGAHYTQFIVYDLDGDGKAEVAMKTAPGTRDAAGNVLGGSNANYRLRNASGYVLSGAEYLTIFNGQTGVAMATTDYVPARGTVSSWGDNYGNRVDRFLAGVAYLDGQRPSLVMARGYYTRAVVVAWDWRNGSLSRRWTFDSNSGGNSAAAGQGAHSLTIGDVDQDGRDEIVYGAATINDNGTLLYSTGLGHGDALHLGDFNPNRPGLEVFMVHESPSSYGQHGIEMHDARTGAIVWSVQGGGDIGRGVTMDVDPRYPGNESWASTGGLYSATGQQITTSKPASINFGVWWDADLLREQLNNTMIDKWNYSNNTSSRLLTAYNYGAASNNGTKATPGLSADLFGDWREEVIWRHDNNSQLLIFSTTAVTTHKLRTLMHDTQYRTAIAWQNVAYNQPPHPSFFLGDGMATPAAPDIYFVGTNPNGGSTGSSSSSSSSSVAAPQVNLSGVAGNGQVSLSWTVNGSINGIEIYRDTDADPAGRTRIASLSASTRSYTATGLTNGQPYWFWVKYTGADGTAYNSNAFNATPVGAATSSSSSVASSSSSSSSSSVASSAVSSSSAASGGSGSCSYVITNNWGSGFTGAIRITNRGSSAINGWNVSWTYSGNTRISNSWNATVSGSNPYSAANLGWNATIQPGQTVEFGFQGTYSGSTETPVISGSVCN
uniref:Rhamnogalacturonan lyase n=1 Tax=Cellvibrio japonicus TaxID=155077 RepID=Q9AF09_CELJA|nr:rhamnogalacturonan lyase [Cellvibrio japonicus]